MGQAKLRGTFEQRKQEAELRDAKERMIREAMPKPATSRRAKHVLNMMIAASIASGAGIPEI